MLEYMKRILLKVSFDLEIFEKELFKARARLQESELENLRNWCYDTFSEPFVPIIERIVGVSMVGASV